MKSVFLIEDTVANRITYFLIMLFLACLPFDRFYSELLLITLSIHTLIHAKEVKRFQQSIGKIVCLQSVFFITLVGCTYSTNAEQGLGTTSKQLGIFIFPILLAITPLNLARFKNNFLFVFSICCTATIVYLYYDAFHIIHFYKLPVEAIFYPSFINHKFSLPINAHATLLSMYCTIALIYLLSCVVGTLSVSKKVIFIALSIVLFAGIVQLSSKAVFASALLIINCCIPFYITRKRDRWVYVAIVLTVSVLSILAIVRIGSLRTRFLTEMASDLTKDARKGDKNEYRIARWEAAMEIVTSAPLMGHGSGSEVKLLKEQYFNRKLYNSYIYELNAHNQYLSFLINNGIVGLMIYLFTLGWGLLRAIRNNNLVLLCFLILISTVSLSEDLLNVNKGIFFYAFFFSYLVLSDEKRTPLPHHTYRRLYAEVSCEKPVVEHVITNA